MPIDLPPENIQIIASPSLSWSLFDEREIRIGGRVRAVVAPRLEPSQDSKSPLLGTLNLSIPHKYFDLSARFDSVGRVSGGADMHIWFSGGGIRLGSFIGHNRATIHAVLHLDELETTMGIRWDDPYDGSALRELIELTFAGIKPSYLFDSASKLRISFSAERKKPNSLTNPAIRNVSITFRYPLGGQ